MTSRNLARVVAKLRTEAGHFDVPVMDHYRDDPFAVLIGCLLSLRTRDEMTYPACKRLFAVARTPETLARLPIRRIEKAIFPVGFYRAKAKTLREISRTLVTRYEGQVPSDLDELLTLKGVGRKTANLVVTLGFGMDGICVDTHVHRICNRWGYVSTKTPDETEAALRRSLPRRYWQSWNDLLVAWGRNLCQPVSPWCTRCPIEKSCARIGVRHSR